mgnify:CR=1 FL=1
MYDRITDDVYEHVGKQLRALRAKNGLTQSEVAKIIKVSPQQYQKYEDAQTKCSLNYIFNLAEFYTVPVDEILPMPSPAPTAEKAENAKIEYETGTEADLLARLVNSYVRLSTLDAKLRLVQLVEAITSKA